ncbi:DUF2141 domain-containing protein [Guyparkeria halopsychrophila]
MNEPARSRGAPGTYALAVIHDENMNGKLDTQWLGIPTEGAAFQRCQG